MKKIILLVSLLSFFFSHAQQKAINPTTGNKQKEWASLLCHQWKLTGSDMQGSKKDKADMSESIEKAKEYSVRFTNDGWLMISGSKTFLSSPYSTFEINGEKYIGIESLHFKITRLTADALEISFSLPIPKMQHFSLTLNSSTTPWIFPSKKLPGTWTSIDKRDHPYFYNAAEESLTDEERKNAILIQLDSTQNSYMLQDTILSTAQWNFDPASAELHITSSGKKYDYMVRDLMDRYLVLSLKEKPDSLITMNEYTSSLQRLENRMSDNRARRRKYEQQSKQSTSSQKNKKGKFSKQGDAAPETITRQRDVGTVTEDVVVEDQNPIPPTTSDELISTWKAIEISSADYENSKAKMELKNETLLTFNKDNTFTLKNGNNTIKGKWKCNKYLRTMYLEVDGQERYCPLTLTSGFYGKDHLTNTDKQLTLILALPGEKEVMKVKFQQVPGK